MHLQVRLKSEKSRQPDYAISEMLLDRKQVWHRLGRVIEPSSDFDWWASHASYPTVLLREGFSPTIFFSVRDAENRSWLASTEIDLNGDEFSVGPVKGPLFGPGPRGAFDADGVTVTSFVVHDGRLLAFYLGWTVGKSVPFTNFIGVAEVDEQSKFHRLSAAPVVGRSMENPFTLGYPWVLSFGGCLKMWFGSHLWWGDEFLEMCHVIKDATSLNGLDWRQSPHVAVPLINDAESAEFAVSRPVVLRESETDLSMWYARRSPQYSIGYAFSRNCGMSWVRSDELFTMSGDVAGWEAEEVTYPCVFDFKGDRYMLYNGNGYGRSGFGIARLIGQ